MDQSGKDSGAKFTSPDSSSTSSFKFGQVAVEDFATVQRKPSSASFCETNASEDAGQETGERRLSYSPSEHSASLKQDVKQRTITAAKMATRTTTNNPTPARSFLDGYDKYNDNEQAQENSQELKD
uniref:Uncharacterized protein n=1 Tax=Ditylenchus dipsaci TaxID=166011 RepID=A0A915E565_9BILA